MEAVGACILALPIDAAQILDFAASLPDMGERDYGSEATVMTFRGRGIAYVRHDGTRLFVKSTRDDRAALVNSEPEVYEEWWSSGRFAWVSIDLQRADADEVLELVLEAWRLTAPKKLTAAYDAGA